MRKYLFCPFQSPQKPSEDSAQLQSELQQVQPAGAGAGAGEEISLGLRGASVSLHLRPAPGVLVSPAQPGGARDGVSAAVPEQGGRDAALHLRQLQRRPPGRAAPAPGQGGNYPSAESSVCPAAAPPLPSHSLPPGLHVGTTSGAQVWRQEEEEAIAITAWK